jgi:hypothetical protein
VYSSILEVLAGDRRRRGEAVLAVEGQETSLTCSPSSPFDVEPDLVHTVTMTTERPQKKPKTTSAPPAPQDAPTQLVLSRLLTQLASATALLTPIPTTPAALISELEVLLTRTLAFKDALGAGEDESQGLVGERGSWKDELDQRGTLLWNKSTAVKIEWGEAAVDSEQWARVVALREW